MNIRIIISKSYNRTLHLIQILTQFIVFIIVFFVGLISNFGFFLSYPISGLFWATIWVILWDLRGKHQTIRNNEPLLIYPVYGEAAIDIIMCFLGILWAFVFIFTLNILAIISFIVAALVEAFSAFKLVQVFLILRGATTQQKDEILQQLKGTSTATSQSSSTPETTEQKK